MKLQDFLKKNIDIDVLGTLTEEWLIAFVGPIKLTEEGKTYFEDILENDVRIHNEYAEIETNNDHEDELASKLFRYAAGYCSCEKYDTLFE